MAGSQAHSLTNPAISHSGEVTTLLIEKFNGQVHQQYLRGENLKVHFNVEPVMNTNMVSNKYIGETELQVLIPGQEPEGKESKFDKNALVIDTSIIARNTVAQLHDVQQDVDSMKSKIAKNQAKQLKRLEDKMIVQQLIFGAESNGSDTVTTGITAGSKTAPRVPGHGFSINIDISTVQASDPNTLLAAIEFGMEEMLKQEVDRQDMAVMVNWESFNVLSDAERIVNTDYVTSTEVPISGYALKRWNLPVIPSNRFPTSVTDEDLIKLSNTANSQRYTPTAQQLKAVAVVFAPDGLLMGMSIAVMSDIFFDKKSKSYFIDSWYAEGAIPDRWESVAVVYNGGSTNATVDARAKRKAKPTTVIS